LAFQNAIGTANFLLGTKVNTVVRQTGTRFLTMLARSIRTTLDGALVGKALFTLEEELFTLAAALTAFRLETTSDWYLALY